MIARQGNLDLRKFIPPSVVDLDLGDLRDIVRSPEFMEDIGKKEARKVQRKIDDLYEECARTGRDPYREIFGYQGIDIDEPPVSLGEKPTLTELEREEVEKRGYEVLDVVGSGGSRDTFLVKKKEGNAERLFVLKRPRRPNPESPWLNVNMEGRDRDLEEVMTSNDLPEHRNVARTEDSLSFMGRTYNFEPFYGTDDLRGIFRKAGKIGLDRAVEILEDIVSAVDHIHSHGYVHRDLKSDNVVIDESGRAVVTDLQLASKNGEIDSNIVFTKGGSEYTHPHRLNSLASNLEDRLAKRDDVYAIGAILLEMLTGETLPYKVKYVEKDSFGSRDIEVGGEAKTIALQVEDRNVNEISNSEHETRLAYYEIVMKERGVPRALRDAVHNSLTTDGRKSYESVDGLKKDIRRSRASWGEKLRDELMVGLADRVKFIGGAGTLLFALGFGAISAALNEARPSNYTDAPFVMDGSMTRLQQARQFDLKSLRGRDRLAMLDTIIPYMEDVERRYPGIEKREEFFEEGWNNLLTRDAEMRGLSKRVVSVLARAGYLTGEDFEQLYKEDGQERHFPSFVPESYVSRHKGRGLERDRPMTVAIVGNEMLRSCRNVSGKQTIADLFAEYYAFGPARDEAAIQSGTGSYFPQHNGETGELIDEGYGNRIRSENPYQANLIDRAVALYEITNDEGAIDYGRIEILKRERDGLRERVIERRKSE